MTDNLTSIDGWSSSLESDYNSTTVGSSARPVRASSRYRNYGFIAVLGLAQRLHIPFLPITWQPARGRLGSGGQAEINQSQLTPNVSFAFRLFNNHQRNVFADIAQELAALSHPVVREHQHIARLEGMCWDISEDGQACPVLVFQKSHLGDLHQFAKRERFRDLSLEDRLSLCADVGIAIRDMHHNGNILYHAFWQLLLKGL